MRTRKLSIFTLVTICLMLIVFLLGCFPSDIPKSNPAGFFSGVWHGWIAPFSLIASIFSNARIYETNNTGFFYDLGFYMAIISGFGGLTFSRKKKKHD